MKILHLIQRPQLRGAEVFASQIGEEHHQAGCTVLFVALFEHTSGTKLKVHGPELKELRLNEAHRTFDLLGYRKLAAVIREFCPDIVQANAADTLKYAVLSKRFFGWSGQLVFRNANKMGGFINSRIKLLYNQFLVNEVDFVASVSENCRIDFLENFRYPADQTQTLTIGTPVVEMLPLDRRKEVRRSFGIGAEDPLLVNVGSFVPEKNHLGLIDVFSRVVMKQPNARMVIVGDGRLRPQIEAAIATAGLGERVTLTGFRQDAVDIVGAADLMLMPSHIEGMPGVILEAMMRGVPVIASAVGGIPEVVVDGHNGHVLLPDDIDGFVNATVSMLKDEEKRSTFGTAARDFVLATKTITRISEEFFHAYRQLLGEDRRN